MGRERKEFKCRIGNLAKYLIKSGVPLITIIRAKTGNVFVFEECELLRYKLEEYEQKKEQSLF